MMGIEIFGLLPLIALGLLFLTLQKREQYWRQSVLLAALIWGLFIALSTEFLSLFKALTFGWFLGAWLVGICLLSIFYINWKPIDKKTLTEETKLSFFLITLIVGILFIFATIGLIAIVSPPNTWDAMTYHLGRVVHWMQNHSVEHYPTYYAPQLYHPPLAEFAIMHFQILSGGDRFANLIQWLSMIGSTIAVSLIAGKLGATVRGQIFAAVFSATLPMGILQGSSTQNDYAVCFWITCFVYWSLVALQTRLTAINAVIIGASLGLACLTKTTAYIFALPFCIWFFLAWLRQKGWQIWKSLLIIGAISLLLNAGHFWRNYELFGYAIGAPQNFTNEYKLELLTLPTFLSNIIRNLSLHMGTKVSLLNGCIVGIINFIHHLLGLSPNDPRTTWGMGRNFFVPSPSFDENNASNPIHFWLIFVVLGIIINHKELRTNRKLAVYTLNVIAAFCSLCLLLKLQPWHSRHHLTIFVLFAPVFGLLVSRLSNKKIANNIAVILLVLSLPWVFNNKFRPLIGDNSIFKDTRNKLYFTNRPEMEETYLAAAEFVRSKQCLNIGLSFWRNNIWEYPFWVFFQRGQAVPRIEHISVRNPILNKKLHSEPFDSFIPCAIIYGPIREEQPIKQIRVKNHIYVQEWSVEPLSVFVQQ